MSAPLSVVMLSHMASPDSPTGAERSLALLARGLVARGHTVQVVVPGAWALESELRQAGVEVRRIPGRACWLAYHEPRPWPVAAWKWIRWAWPDAGARELAQELRRGAADVAYVNCLPHVRGALAARSAGLQVVWHVREILPPGFRRRWFARRMERSAGSIVAVSEAVGDWIRDEGLNGRVDVVYNGVEERTMRQSPAEARQQLGLPVEGCVIGLFGQLLPHKGAGEFVRAAATALRREDGLRFVLAGPGPASYRERLQAAITAAGVDARVHLLPAQPTSEVLLDAADVVALTTRTPDPLPRAVLEGMAAGRPVAAFRSGGAPEMVQDGETGVLVDTDDVEGLADAFVKLGRDAALRERMGRAGRCRAQSFFSLSRHVERMEQLLVRAAGR